MKPFRAIVKFLDRVAEGGLDEDIAEESYRETKQISRAINKTLQSLKAVDQSRQEFVSNVSHELKTPITSIRVLVDSLMSMDEVPKELYQEFMGDISDEIDRESKIIDDLLTLVRMDKSSAEINITQTNINALVEMILKRLRPIARRRNIELIFESIREVTADIDEVKVFPWPSTIWWKMQSNTTVRTDGCGSLWTRTTSSFISRSRIPASVSRRNIRSGYSSGSTGWIRPDPGRPAAQAWDLQSPKA